MSSNIKTANLDGSPVIPKSSASEPTSSLSNNNPTSTGAGTSQEVVDGSNKPRKHIIRTIIPLDPKKLQKAGLDRKIAEALSKQKSQQNSYKPNQNVDVMPTNSLKNQTAISKLKSHPLPAKYVQNKTPTNKLKPPKIAITGPEALTDQEKRNLAHLNPQQRLVHVKNLLNKKLLEKQSKIMNDVSETNQILKTSQAIGNSTQQKSHTKVTRDQPHPSKNLYLVLKETSPDPSPKVHIQPGIKLSTNPPKQVHQKSQQIIAKKLIAKPTGKTNSNDYSKPSASHPYYEEFLKCSSKDEDKIPKASITPLNIQQEHKNIKQYARKSRQVGGELPPPIFKQDIVKEPRAIIQLQTRPKQQKLDFPEVPSTNLPKETPLPAIGSFKKPYSLASTSCYNLQKTPSHCATSLYNQQPTTSQANHDSNRMATATNSLVVLENKILSQDEMIDLTELRLSSNTPRFIYPHIPIPEVVIKQEHVDDYQSTDTTFTQALPATIPTQIKVENTEQTPVLQKQKTIIINAQQLKLAPEQLNDLTRKLQQKIEINKTKAKESTNQVADNKNQAATILDFKIANQISLPKNVPHQKEFIVKTSSARPQDIMLPNKHIYKTDHDYYDGHRSYIITNVDANAGKETFNYNEKPQDAHFNSTTLDMQEYSKTAVEIIDEPVPTEDSFSAVDFIAALSNTSTELSPEELNLSASCTFNQNYSHINVSESPQKIVSPVIQATDNIKNVLKRTIVIESSKGQETILTKNSPDKNDLEKVKEKIKIYHEMNKQKLANLTTTKPKSSNKLQHDVSQTRSANDSKLHDNTNVCNKDTKEIPPDQQFCATERRADHLNSSKEPKLSKNYTEPIVKPTVAVSNRCQESIGIEPLTKTPINTCAMDLAGTSSKPLIVLNDIKSNDHRQETPAVIAATKNLSKDFITPTDGQTGNQQLDIPAQAENSVQTAAATSTVPPKTGIPQNNETIANTTIAVKRVSKFKKGKINLVARNKLPTVDKKIAAVANVTDKKEAQALIENKGKELCNESLALYGETKDTQIDEDPKIKTAEKPEAKNTKCIQQLEQSHNKLHNMSQPTAAGNNEDNSKLARYCDEQKKPVESEELENAKIQHQTSEKETSTPDLTAESAPLALKPETAGKNFEKDSVRDASNMPKASTNTLAVISIKSNKVLVSETETPQVSVKPIQSLTGQAAQVSETVSSQLSNDEESSTAQRDENANSKEKSVTENLGQESANSKAIRKADDLPTTASPTETAKTASKEEEEQEDKIVKISQQVLKTSSESAELQNKDNNKISLKSTQMETKLAKEQDFALAENLSQQCLPKALESSMEKLQQSKIENANITLTQSLKVTNESSASGLAAISKTEEEEEQKGICLSKAVMGKLTKASFSDNLKETGEINSSNEEKRCQPSEEPLERFSRLQKPSSELAGWKNPQSDTSPLKISATEKTNLPKTLEEKTTTASHCSQHSQAVLQTMKSATIPLIDIVKHSLREETNKLPILPFKKTFSDAKHNHPLSKTEKAEREDIKKDEQLPEIQKTEKESRKAATLKEEESNERSSSTTSEALISTHLPPKITRKRLSVRPFISDDDLEFLPENAEVRFNLARLKQQEENKKSNIDESLYPSTFKKRNRFYSQTLETDVTITFDSLQTEKRTVAKNVQNVVTDESCHDSNQDLATPTKQRKKLRKTVEDIKKSQKALSDTDSDDFERDCEETNEFLGFEDDPAASSSFQNLQHDLNNMESESKTKHGGLKNWLTTGKAISPTSDKAAGRKRLRQTNVSPVASTSLSAAAAIPETKPLMHIKKRWDLCSKNTYAETDITDDTSPADDEEEISEQIPVTKKLKRGIKNVTDSNKNTIDSKKIKLNEHNFKSPPAIIQNCVSTSEGTTVSSQQLSESSSKEYFAKISKSAAIVKATTKCRENVCTKLPLPENSPNANGELSVYQNISEISCSDNESEANKQLKSKQADKCSKKGNENVRNQLKKKTTVEPKASSLSAKKTQETVTAGDCLRSKEVDLICTSNIDNKLIEPKNHTEPENYTLTNVEPQKKKRGRKPKASQKTNEITEVSPTVLQQQEIARNRSETPKAKSLKGTEQACSTPESVPTNKRKRGKAKQVTNNLDDSSDDETSLLSYKKRILKDMHDLDESNSLLTPLLIKDFKTEECNSNSLLTPVDKTIETDTSMNDDKQKGKRGRQPVNDATFNPRLLLVTKREQLDTDEILTEAFAGSGSIQCGLCLAHTQPNQWNAHLAQHYGVGWQVGKEKLNIENRNTIFNTIKNYMQNNKSTGLACRMCQKVLRSALGLLTHIDQCGDQKRAECEFCKKNYSKNSLIAHLRTCKVRQAVETQTMINENLKEKNGACEEIVGNLGRFKRHSTIKAENKLKALGKELESVVDSDKPVVDPKLHIKYVPCEELNFTEKWTKEIENVGHASCPGAWCHFTNTDIKELTEHFQICKRVKAGFICQFCRKAFQTEQEAIDHIIANHKKGRQRRTSNDSECSVKTNVESSSDDLSEGVDEDGSDTDGLAEEDELGRSKLPKKRYTRTSMIENRKELFDGRSRHLDKEVLNKWISFTNTNYSCESLYNEFTPQYSVLNLQDYERYLPVQTVSMKFNITNNKKLIQTVGLPQTNMEWSELKRFESISNKSNTYSFLGAPIKMCSWLPLPADVSEQYLAVVYRRDMYKYIKFSQPKQHHSIVLLFKVTHKNKVPELSVHYGLVVNDGPVHHLAFLPSGGYDNSTNRLGLIAVGTVTSCIKVYSLPINVDASDDTDNCNTIEHIKLIDVKPSFVLSLDVSKRNESDKYPEVLLSPQCLQICWSEFSGHQHIFAGFSNGFIGVWNIKDNPQENLNRFVIDDIINYTPLNYFFLGEKCIKCLALHYDSLGPRWMAAATLYRKIIVFDIKNLTNPVVYKEDNAKNVVASIDWCPIWETFLFSYDDAVVNIGNGVTAVNPSNVIFAYNKIDGAQNGILQAHYTPLANLCVTASSNGEIVFLNTKELHYDYCLSRKSYERRALYSLDVQRLDGEALVRLPKETKQKQNVEIPSGFVMFDHMYKEKYGLIFTPLQKLDDKSKAAYLSEKRIPPPNILPYMRINTLRCNINQQGKHLVAAGYENGFLRLIYFNKDTVFP